MKIFYFWFCHVADCYATNASHKRWSHKKKFNFVIIMIIVIKIEDFHFEKRNGFPFSVFTAAHFILPQFYVFLFAFLYVPFKSIFYIFYVLIKWKWRKLRRNLIALRSFNDTQTRVLFFFGCFLYKCCCVGKNDRMEKSRYFFFFFFALPFHFAKVIISLHFCRHNEKYSGDNFHF